MNCVVIQSDEDPLPSWSKKAERFTLTLLERLQKEDWEVSILFCSDEYIRSLNFQFRKKDEATDVLSFFLGETIEENGGKKYLPGDIVISLETLYKNSQYFNVSPDEELRRLLIHGILHLSGMDHEGSIDNKDRALNADIEPMLQLQEELLADLVGERILP